MISVEKSLNHFAMKTCLPVFAIVIALLVPASGLAQPYSINWHKIAGGGGTSIGGGYQVSGTIGQPDASRTMTGGIYGLTGGFWGIYAVQGAGAPLLTITPAGKKTIVSWPSSVTGWTLQTNVNLATPTWGNYLGTVINNSVTNQPPPNDLFFRLKQGP